MLQKDRFNQCPMIYLRKLIHKIYAEVAVNIRKPLKALQVKHMNAEWHFTHVSCYSVSNVGDTVLSSAVRDLFLCFFGNISFNLKNVVGNVTKHYIQGLNRTDAVIIGGHGLFLPDTNANSISNWEFACSELQYDEIIAPIVVFAVGYNYFHGQERTPLFESNIKKLVQKSAFFGLRNRGSVREIQSFLDDDQLKEKVVYQPCPTMVARYLYPDLPPKKETKKVAVNVALDRSQLRMGDKVDVILDQIAEAMYLIAQKGYEIYFVTHMCAEIPFLQYLKKYRFPYQFKDVSTWDVKRLMRFYNEMDVVIGMRGHGIWVPFGVNCQIISLGNQNKTKWFLEDIDAMDWYIEITEQPENLAKRIVEKFIEIHETNGDETNERLLETQKRLWQITCYNLEEIKRKLQCK